MRHEDGHIARIVARSRILLLVRCLVLFVDDDQSEILKGQKHRRAHAEQQRIGVFAQLPLPNLHALVVRKLRMVDPELFAEHAAETIGNLRCQRDFGQQKQDLFSLGDDAPNEFDVDFRLPARRHAV